MQEHDTKQEIAQALRELEAGQYIAEDQRKEPLRVCEQQPEKDGLLHAVSQRGTVYALEKAASGVRMHRGSSIKEDVSEMASDGFIDSLRVVGGEELITPLPHEVSAVEHLTSYRQPTLIEGWSVGGLGIRYRGDTLLFHPLSLDEAASEVTVNNSGEIEIGGRPLEAVGERMAFVMNRL